MTGDEKLVEDIRASCLSAFKIGAREMAMMVRDGDLDGREIEDAIEQARKRAFARIASPWLVGPRG